MTRHIGHAWFGSGSLPMGLVLAYNDITHEMKAWINVIPGFSEEEDIKTIMSIGSKFPVQEAMSLCMKIGTIVISQDALLEILKDSLVDDEVNKSSAKGD